MVVRQCWHRVMSVVLHDVARQHLERLWQCGMHGTHDLGFGKTGFARDGVPAYIGMRVMGIGHDADQSIPDQVRKEPSQDKKAKHRSARIDRCTRSENQHDDRSLPK